MRELFAPGSELVRHLQWITAGRSELRSTLYGPALQGHSRDGSTWLTQALGDEENGSEDPIARVMRLDQRMWLPDDVLAKADRASMMNSLEVRTPYLDRNLVEFAGSFPAAVHYSHEGKPLLRAALGKILPEAASTRPKTAFRVPAADWLRGPLSGVMQEQLRSGQLYGEGWFQREAVAHLNAEHQSGMRDWNHVLWPLLALGLWLDRFRGAEVAVA
jgi:asparagine synthase (glutamine-hydrolysing)